MGCVVIAVMLVVGTIIRGLVLSQYWGWFVVPLGVVPITVPWALGISSLAWFLTSHANSESTGDKSMAEIAVKLSVAAVLGPVLMLGLGWIYHAWM